MANTIRSRLTFLGKNAEEVLEKVTLNIDTGEHDDFDFNRIIPMPAEVDEVEASPITDACAKLFINGMVKGCEAYERYAKLYTEYNKGYHVTVEMDEERFTSTLADVMKMWGKPDSEPRFKTKADVFAYGKKALDNIEKYGAMDWHSWRVKYWGTKWNAADVETYGREVCYETPWSTPDGVLKELTRQYPGLVLRNEYADEDLGYGVGVAFYKNGERYEVDRYDDCSREAMELAADLWHECLVYDKKSGLYKRVE